MKKLFIWGAGNIGKRILGHFDNEWDIIFVESDESKAGSVCCGKQVIGVKQYFEQYSDEFVLVAHLHEVQSLEILQKNKVNNYFIHCDCPGEFKEPYAKDNLKKYILHYLANRNDYVLYGLNLYSIIIDSWLYKEYKIHPYILLQNNITEDLVEKIEQKYTELNVIQSMDRIKNVREVCICSFNYHEIKEEGRFHEFQLTDIFDCTDKIEQYYNPAIEKVYHLHKGERCFIVATGPSLKMKDLDLLKDNKEICISMNSIFYAFDETQWRPDYYVMSDYRGFSEYKEVLDRLPVKKLFLNDHDEEFWSLSHEKNIYQYHQHCEYCFDRLPKFTDNFSRKSYIGATVTYTCMQLAAYMGFEEIYLLGVDFSYANSTTENCYDHFHKEEKLSAVGYERHVKLAYEAARKYADEHGIKIYNATRGGKLEVFDRVDFDTLF